MHRFHVELRAEVEGNKLVGHAAVFNQVSDVGMGLERLAPTAFDRALKDPTTDVRALLNHDPAQLLGRQSSGTLRLGTDKEGLRFEVDLPDTSYANDLRQLLARGDLTGASFGFIPGDEETERSDGRQVRVHTSVERLIDVSAVTFPAYEGASVALRHLARPRRTDQLIRARARVLLGGK